MKFRCTRDSIRLRVRKSDLEILQDQGEVSDYVQFGPDDRLSFTLALSQTNQVQAVFTKGVVRVDIPQALAQQWIDSEEVGIEAMQPNGGVAQQLHILVEKDFPCRHTTETSREDTFFELAPEDPSIC